MTTPTAFVPTSCSPRNGPDDDPGHNGITGTDVGIRPFGYVTSMVVTIGLWLALAPAVGAIARTAKKK